MRKSLAEAKVSGGSKEVDRVGCGVNRPPLGTLPLAPCEAAGASLVFSLVVSRIVPEFHRSDCSGDGGDNLGRFRLLNCVSPVGTTVNRPAAYVGRIAPADRSAAQAKDARALIAVFIVITSL